MATSGGRLGLFPLAVTHDEVNEECSEVAICVGFGRQAGRAGVIIGRPGDAQTGGGSISQSARAEIISVAARGASEGWGLVVLVVVVVVVLMGDSRRHKDQVTQPNGGWLTVAISSLNPPKEAGRVGGYCFRQSRGAGASCRDKKHSRELLSQC